VVRIEPDDQNLQKFTHRVESELAYLKTPLPTATRKKRIERLEAAISGWANGGFKLCDNVKALRTQWLAQANAQGNENLESVSEEQKPVTNTIKKTFKLHPDQMEMLETALKYVKAKSGTANDTVALEYIVQEFMGCGMGFANPKAALVAERKKAGSYEDFLGVLAGLSPRASKPQSASSPRAKSCRATGRSRKKDRSFLCHDPGRSRETMPIRRWRLLAIA
jgi:hypothetical protein